MAQEQSVIHPSTSSKTGSFYFAFGSNLSPYQMSIRLKHSPSSSVPVAIARLDSHAWIICQRGYANVVSLPPSNAASDDNTVWGVIYNLDPVDEARLDMYEGHNEARNPTPEINPDPETQHIKRYLQGGWDYNKQYLPVTVTKWLRDPNEYGVSVPDWDGPGLHNTTIRALVYVDEFRTSPGKIAKEYIGRMNRAIDESVKLGLPQSWVDHVMRKFIPPGIYVDKDGYVGADEGYVEAEATEADDHIKESTLKDST
ncbi:hypothetical protein HRR83_001662 [Exophiala dermatitidis]|uniref:gamma-glutamylcyclotransferase n=2 Tax=Exophiala dermatitidis TaxID=5970 RepID=H6C5S3_EXODN|nr:uncharacterized protein HMPREF1120_07068 [Exophiala dermatitidis NIH/UT8656]KAJ4516333.1 hypothetical protein HRR73_004796 [Exophiala dermatitidis]EHY59069.1 hypothetical protein HMPREF1120_07068 [Exophiala dermatitidis NIH/UT8656]KAJ4526468.1 hypothetical protein HRR74_001666 [Exophiala dermatitidis]KAJ4532286.1 hypothetical protein HRR76_007284 [Exophiala dermatitidis]KAJ4546323.1 hypothetical protein HRR77_004858 [Exophiala dermatitidis]